MHRVLNNFQYSFFFRAVACHQRCIFLEKSEKKIFILRFLSFDILSLKEEQKYLFYVFETL